MNTHVANHDHGSRRGYVIGFLLSGLLTAGSFAAVMAGLVPHAWRMGLLTTLAVAQLIVQLVYFLHLGSARAQRDNTGIFLCTAFLIAIVVAGSLWVMHNANVNMMPMDMSQHDAMMRE